MATLIPIYAFIFYNNIVYFAFFANLIYTQILFYFRINKKLYIIFSFNYPYTL